MASANEQVVHDQIRSDIIENAAGHAGYLKQREADELQAGRRFENALEWIRYTQMTKGERSGNTLNALVQTGHKTEKAFYTQTHEYHKTGTGSISLEHNNLSTLPIILKDGDRDVFRMDMERARLFDHVLASTGNSNICPLSGSHNQSRSSVLGSSRYHDNAFGIRFRAGPGPSIAASFQDSPQMRMKEVHQPPNSSGTRVESANRSLELTALAQLEALATSVALTVIDD